jgi:DNA invertase Pin-like site-specific DNA recombinase
LYRDAAFSSVSVLRAGYEALLECVREAAFDIVVANSLDRISRDLGDITALLKRLKCADIKLAPLSRGKINELRVGLGAR